MTDDGGQSALPPYVRALREPAAYPHRPASVEFVQTHISYVFLAGDLAYKAKKSVNLGFVDQATLETRKRHCYSEVRLNRRLAPKVYLGVVPIVVFEDGRFEVEPDDPGAGEVIEWAVKMRRLPDDRMLGRLIHSGAVPGQIAQRLVATLVPFHMNAQRVRNDPSYAGVAAVRRWWAQEYEESESFIGDTWRSEDAQTLRVLVEAMLDQYGELLDQRLAGGYVIEGHGDLRAEHVYVLDDDPDAPLVIVDCIEFTDRFHFRHLDVGYDIAFLAMDLEAQGRADLADEFAGRYIAATADETMALLQPLHRAFRAFVRGKVRSIGSRESEISPEQRREMAASAARHFALATAYARRQSVSAVVVMTGLSGTGKSIVGATVAAHIGAAYVSSDAIRKTLHDLEVHEHRDAEFQQRLYAWQTTERVYDEMRRRAAAHLALGRPVVLDATHSRAANRHAARAVARHAGVSCLVVNLRLDRATALSRIAARRADPLATSDATEEVYEQQSRRFEPITLDEHSLLLDAAEPVHVLVGEIVAALPDRE